MTPLRHNPAQIAVILLSVCGGLLTALELFDQANGVPVALSTSVLIILLLVTAFVALVRRSSLWDGHGPACAWAMAWGGLATAIFVGVFQAGASDLVTSLGLDAIEASFAGAWPEEIAKNLGVLLILLAWAPRLRRPSDGLVVGMFTGLGFELLETLGYATESALTHPDSDLLGTLASWQSRELFFGAGLHVIFTGMAGWGVGQGLLAGRWRSAVLWQVAAFVLHFAWNAAWPEPLAQPMAIAIYVVCLALLLSCWVAARRSLRPSQATPPPGPTQPGALAATV